MANQVPFTSDGVVRTSDIRLQLPMATKWLATDPRCASEHWERGKLWATRALMSLNTSVSTRLTHAEIRRLTQPCPDGRPQCRVCPVSGCGGHLVLFGHDNFSCKGNSLHL